MTAKTVQKITLSGCALAAALATMTAAPENAQAAAIDFTAPTVDTTNNTWSLGFKFSTNKDITVNSLGFYDDLKNDLTESHDIGIFDEIGNLLVSGTVNPGDVLDGWFRYTTVASTKLQAGKTFFIAATTGSENYTYDPTGFAVDPNINYLGTAYTVSSSLVFPSFDSFDTTKGYFGPNFDYEATTPVPTPALLPGLVGLGAAALRKRSQKDGESAEA